MQGTSIRERGTIGTIVLLWLLLLVPQTTFAYPPSSDELKPADDGQPKPLTLRGLFHPDEKIDYDGDLPDTHWIKSADGSPMLLIRRDGNWLRHDLNSHEETPWPLVGRLAGQLQTLDGVDAEKAMKVAGKVVKQIERADQQVLIRIDKSLAIASAGKLPRWVARDADGWQNVTLDPTEQRVAYTRDGDLFLLDIGSGTTMRLTDDGTETLLDGVLDWTYQEEIYGRGNFKGFWFSPDGRYLAMLRIDIERLEPYVMSASKTDRGRGIVRRYSKAGDPIPQAQLLVWDLNRFVDGKIAPPQSIEASTAEDERLITGVYWHPSLARLMYIVSDRLQSWREIRVVEAASLATGNAKSGLVLREESPAWVEPPTPPQWIDADRFLWRSDVPSGRSRLYIVAVDGQTTRPISPDNFDVASFTLNASATTVFVTGDADRGSVESQLYRIDFDDDSHSFARVTDQAGWHDVDFSAGATWWVDRHSTPARPPVLSLRSSSQTAANQTEANHSADFTLATSELRTASPIIAPELFTIQTSDGVPLPAMLVKPDSTIDSTIDTTPKKHAVVIEVYGGPQAPIVSARWGGTKTLYREWLARQGIATLVVDNRSSGGRGVADAWSIRRRVGEVEMDDLRVAVDWLGKQPWVDADRLAIRGWSFGGFLTLYAMTHSDAFAAGIAGGSVTQWSEYDSIYTERYMGLPLDNADGYARTSPIVSAEKLQGSLLMIHGEEDDNVHPSHTLRMAAALQSAGKDFQLMIYPGAGHGVTEQRQNWHLQMMTTRFLLDELKP